MGTAPVGIGIIGRGFGQRIVAPVFAETDGCEVIAVVSPRDGDGVAALYTNPAVDLIAVHSPPFCHRDLVLSALAAGKAVLCDKPFGSNADDASVMETAARDAEVPTLLNFEFRHHPGRVRLRELVLDGAVGTVDRVHWTAFNAGSRVPLRDFGWLFDASRGGGWVGAWGSHAIDFLRWTFGEIASAAADLHLTLRERPDRDGELHTCTAEDGFTARMRTVDGAAVTIDTTFAARVNLAPRITVLGSDGALESVADGSITRRTDAGKDEVFRFDAPREDPHLVPMRAWAEVVRDAVRDGAVPDGEATFADGLACALVMDQLRA